MAYTVDWEIGHLKSPSELGRLPERSGRGNGPPLVSPPGGLDGAASGAVVAAEPTANRLRRMDPDADTPLGEGSGLQDGAAAY